METIVSSGYRVLPTQQVAKAIINSILEFCDDVKQREEDRVGCTCKIAVNSKHRSLLTQEWIEYVVNFSTTCSNHIFSYCTRGIR